MSTSGGRMSGPAAAFAGDRGGDRQDRYAAAPARVHSPASHTEGTGAVWPQLARAPLTRAAASRPRAGTATGGDRAGAVRRRTRHESEADQQSLTTMSSSVLLQMFSRSPARSN